MAFYYTPFDVLVDQLKPLGAHGGRGHGNCLAGQSEIAVVAHGDATSSTIGDNYGNELSAEDLVEMMLRQGLSRSTHHIFLHACNGGGSVFERGLVSALHRHRELRGITVTGYGGAVGTLRDGRAVVIPAGYRGGKRNRDGRVQPSSSSGSGRR